PATFNKRITSHPVANGFEELIPVCCERDNSDDFRCSDKGVTCQIRQWNARLRDRLACLRNRDHVDFEPTSVLLSAKFVQRLRKLAAGRLNSVTKSEQDRTEFRSTNYPFYS